MWFKLQCDAIQRPTETCQKCLSNLSSNCLFAFELFDGSKILRKIKIFGSESKYHKFDVLTFRMEFASFFCVHPSSALNNELCRDYIHFLCSYLEICSYFMNLLSFFLLRYEQLPGYNFQHFFSVSFSLVCSILLLHHNSYNARACFFFWLIFVVRVSVFQFSGLARPFCSCELWVQVFFFATGR